MAIKRSTGLIDKLNGQTANLIANGTFTTDTTSWIAANATLSSIAGGNPGNSLNIANSASLQGEAYQDIVTVPGRLYKLSFSFKRTTAASGSVNVGSGIYTGPALTPTVWTDYSVAFIATGATTRITLKNGSAVNGEAIQFDNIVVDTLYDGFNDIFRGGFINIYTGGQPANADAASTGTLLAVVSIDATGTGLTFADSVAGVVGKPAGVTWKGLILANGTAGWFRLYEAGDTPTVGSSTAARVDGTIGLTGSGADMIVAVASLTAGLNFEVTGAVYTPSKG